GGGVEQVTGGVAFALHRRASDLIGAAGFPNFNIDLIYGMPGQTLPSWERSLREAVASPATSLFLYPLYVRPMTGLGVRQRSLETWSAPTTRQMAAMYDLAVGLLPPPGFRQSPIRP